MSSLPDVSSLPIDQMLELQEEISNRIAKLRAEEKGQALTKVRELVQQYALTSDEVFGGRTAKRKAVASEPKYRNPATGQTWTGHGRAPDWIVGQDRTKFAI